MSFPCLQVYYIAEISAKITEITISWAFIQLVKSASRAVWKKWHCCDMFEDFETFQSVMKKKKNRIS